MAQENVTGAVSISDHGSWQGGVLAGLVAGAVMGVVLSVQMTPVIQHAIPALYGFDGGVAGWVVHMSHGAVLGVVFAGVAGTLDAGDSLLRSVVAGLGYGVALWVLLAALVMPVWLGAVGFPKTPPLPNFNPTSLVGHVVYGAVLGVVYPAVRNL